MIIRFDPASTAQDRAAYVESIGGTVSQSIDALDAVVVTVPEDVAAGPLPASPAVAQTEPDYQVTALDAPVNDPLYDQQWALPVIGAPEAWAAMPPDAPRVTVAVIDSGICADHPDLQGRILPGWDFIENDAVPQDDFGHGCGVAGIIAANADDGVGMAGVAPNAMILPLRVLNTSGIGTYSDVAAAIVRAADEGAQVINLSLGGAFSSTVLDNAVDYAVEKGVTVVAAAGNTGSEQILYPAAYAPVIAVGAVDKNFQCSSFSSYGHEIDLWAPGRDILVTARDDGYTTMSGTSLAAPHVAGVAALEVSMGRTLTLGGGIVGVGETRSIAESTATGIFELSAIPSSEAPGMSALSLIGPDDTRSRITTPADDYPFSAIAYVDIGLSWAGCSGSVISSRYVLTAAHCVDAGPPTQVFIGRDGLDYIERMNVASGGWFVPQQWVSGKDAKYDYAVLELESPLVSPVGTFAVGYFSDGYLLGETRVFNTAGYPSDKCSSGSSVFDCDDSQTQYYRSDTLWYDTRGPLQAIEPFTDRLVHKLDVEHGQSGSPMWITGNNVQVGVIASGDDCYGADDGEQPLGYICPSTYNNYSTRITPEVIQQLRDWNISFDFVTNCTAKLTLAVEGSGSAGAFPSATPGCGYSEFVPGYGPISLFAIPDPGWEFSHWIGATGDSYTVNGTATVTAVLVPTNGTDPELEALTAFYNSTGGPNWLNNDGWLIGDDPCVWYGVVCARGNLEHLTLDGNQLTGSIPSQLGSLVNLRALWLGDNQLTGSIPTQLGNLANLEQLILSGNQLTGSIPSQLGSLVNLRVLWLGDNQLTGSIPTQLGNLANLEQLMLDRNQLTGSIPSQLGSLVNLRPLWLFDNQLTGSIPTQLGNLANLEQLILDGNQLIGSIPSQLNNLVRLRVLGLSNNQLTGNIPSVLGNLTALYSISLGGNQLTGSIPVSFGNLIDLTYFNLGENQLTGPIPPELGNLSNVEVFSLGRNQLTGSIPVSFGNLIDLTYFNLGENQLTGPIPPELGNLSNVKVFSLGRNQLTGSIPSQLGGLSSVTWFGLGQNQLTGTIPPQLGNLTNLQLLDLGSNRLSGTLPPELGNLTNLYGLFIANNALSGAIPFTITNLTGLSSTQTTLDFNALYSNDPVVTAFLNSKSSAWEYAQTVAPTNVAISTVTNSSVQVTWLPILYTGNGGGYEVSYATTLSGPYTVAGMTADKNAMSFTVTGLTPQTSYYFRVRTHTPPHIGQQNDLYTDYTMPILSTTRASGPWVDCDTTSDGIASGDCAALVDIYDALAPNAWLSSDAPCSWTGVVCNSASPRRVTGIDIQLVTTKSGALPPSIGTLTELQKLDTTLADITGAPPEIGNLTNLVFLDLAYSDMTSLPSEIGNLTNLQSLFLGNGGGGDIFTIPTWVGNLTNLTALGLYQGGFYGEIPIQVCNLTSLEFLGLNTNRLSGVVPSCLTNLIHLNWFHIQNNPLLTATDPTFCSFLSTISDADWDAGVCPPAPPPNAPSDLTQVGIKEWTLINLSWTDNSSDEASFRIERSLNGTTGWAEISIASANQTSLQETALPCSATYYYRVRAYRSSDGLFSVYSNVAKASTKPCSPPDAAPARNRYTTATPTLTWSRLSQAAAYEVQVDDGATFAAPVVFSQIVGIPALSVTVTPALTDGTYYWRVRARDRNGIWGSWSAVDSFVVDAN